MIPELFSIGSLSISPFGIFMVIAFLAAWVQLRWGVRRLGVGDEEDASALLLAAGVGGIVGAKAYYAALYGDWRLLFDRAGLVWYGALAFGALAVLWIVRRRRLPLAAIADVAAPTVALGYAIGRVGCFLVGDDYGLPTRLPWGVAFPHGLPGPTTAGFMRSEYGAVIGDEVPAQELVPVHPTQLYEALAGLAIWALGVRGVRRVGGSGVSALLVLALLAVERFAVEFLRAKDDRFFGSLTLAQVLSLALLALLVVLEARRRRRLPAAAARSAP